MPKRHYVDVSHFRSPYDSPTLSLSGLGAMLGAAIPRSWPVGRSYVDVAHFRAPYDQGYFQDNNLFGLGAESEPPPAPVVVERPTVMQAAVGLLTLSGVMFAAGLGWYGAKTLMRGRHAE